MSDLPPEIGLATVDLGQSDVGYLLHELAVLAGDPDLAGAGASAQRRVALLEECRRRGVPEYRVERVQYGDSDEDPDVLRWRAYLSEYDGMDGVGTHVTKTGRVRTNRHRRR